MAWFNNLSLQVKMSFIVIVAVVGLVGLEISNLNAFRDQMLQSRVDKTRQLTQTAFSVLQYNYERFKSGDVSEEEAKINALRAIEALRYEGKEYFWVNDYNAVVKMHPYVKDIIDIDLKGHSNKKLFPLFKAFAEVAQKNPEGGSHAYSWPKAGEDPEALFDKISYVQAFKPWSWVVGTGIYIDDVNRAFMGKLVEAAIQLGIVIILVAGFCYVSARSVVVPVSALVEQMSVLESDPENCEIAYEERKDEIGNIARAMLMFKANAIEKIAMEKKQEEARELAEEEKRAMLENLANDFDATVQKVVLSLTSSVSALNLSASDMKSSTGESCDKSDRVCTASKLASDNVTAVAGAIEQMNSAISEIAQQVTDTRTAAVGAADAAVVSNDKITGLNEAANKIGEVIGLITDIAEQTNLLALNATIEAARAGDAGKGFAVVASEVKNLATQTSKATGEITQQIEAIQASTREVTDAISQITSTIGGLSSTTTAVASAVEEQSAATAEISRAVQEASEGTKQVDINISDVKHAAETSGDAAVKLCTETESLEGQTASLRKEVEKFITGIRNTAGAAT